MMRILVALMVLLTFFGCKSNESSSTTTKNATPAVTDVPENLRARLLVDHPANGGVVFLPLEARFRIQNTEFRKIYVFLDGEQVRIHDAEDVAGTIVIEELPEGIHQFRFELRDNDGNSLPDPFSKVTIADVTIRTPGAGGGGMDQG